MNVSKKIAISRIILTFIIIFILIFPFDAVGVEMIKLFVNESIVVDVRYLISGVLFTLAFIIELFNKHTNETLNDKLTNLIADKFLINSVLIILTSQGLIHPIIPVIIVARDIIVGIIKTLLSTKSDETIEVRLKKIKNIILMLGIILTLFNNLPFELINIKISDVLLILATVLSVYSAIIYYETNKKYII